MSHTKGNVAVDSRETLAIRDDAGGLIAILSHLKGHCGLGGRRNNQEAFANARRLAALWNAAERAALPTEDIENGKIERALERIEKLEAEKAEMVVALKTMVEMVEMNGFGKHYALDLARAAIRREEK